MARRASPGAPVALLYLYMALFMVFIMAPIVSVVVVSFSSSSFIVLVGSAKDSSIMARGSSRSAYGLRFGN